MESLASGAVIAAGSSTLRPPAPSHHRNPEDDGKRTQMDDAASLFMNDYYTDEDGGEVGEDGEAFPTDKYVYAPESAEEWDENFEILRNFYVQHGHCDVPFSGAWTDLANWLYGQHRSQGRLKQDQRAKLAALGALSQRQKRQASWDEHYAELVEFKKKHGHCDLPRSNPEFTTLLNWLMTSRQCRYKSCGTHKRLTESQIDKLISIGALEAEGHIPGRSSCKNTQEIQNCVQKTWDEQFKMLEAFRSQFGHCKVPANETKWESLSQWLQTQKQSYYEKRLSMRQLRKLAAAGAVQIHRKSQSPDSRVNTTAKSSGNSKESTPQSVGNGPLLKDASSPAAALSVLPALPHQTEEDDVAAPVSSKRIRMAKSCCNGDWFPCRVHIILADWTTREIGFVLLPSRASSTLADARRKILDTLLLDPVLQGEDDFEFFLPLGPVTKQQESSVGPMFNFLKYHDPSRGFSKEGDAQLFLVKRSDEQQRMSRD